MHDVARIARRGETGSGRDAAGRGSGGTVDGFLHELYARVSRAPCAELVCEACDVSCAGLRVHVWAVEVGEKRRGAGEVCGR